MNEAFRDRTIEIYSPDLRSMRLALCNAANQTGAPGRGPDLTKPELSLLDQCQTLEHQFERRALIYRDTALDEHVSADQSKLAQIQRIYDGIEAQIVRSPGGIKKGRYTLGDQVATYGPASSFETIVFVRGQGKLKLLCKGQFTGRLTLVDARNGEVLAFSEFTCDSHSWPKSANELESHIRESLAELAMFL